jgi:phage shock protein PspC (stress-responsive transcriptional regulator)
MNNKTNLGGKVMSDKKLVRKQSDKLLFGVSGGVADYIGIDPVIVRLIFVLLTLWHGWGLLIYLVLAIVMPVEGEDVVAAKANPFDDEEIVIKDA